MISIDFEELDKCRKIDYWEWRDKVCILCAKLYFEYYEGNYINEEKEAINNNIQELKEHYGKISDTWILPDKENYKTILSIK